MEKNYDAIDLMKFIAAILIVGIHTSALSDVSPLLNNVLFQGVGRLALPLFFIASGFFLSKKIQNDREHTKQIVESYAKRIGILYVFWMLFNAKWIWETWFANIDGSFIVNLSKFMVGIIFQSTFSGSWYLTSCIFSAILYFWILRKRTLKQKLIFTGIIFIAVATLSLNLDNSLVHFLKNVLYLPVSIFVGPIYFAVGDIVAHDKVSDIKKNINVYWLGLGVSVMLWVAELYFKNKVLISTDQLYIYPIIGYFIFSLLLTSDVKIPYAYQMRKISSIMYLSQFTFIFLNHAFLDVYNLSSWMFFVIITVQIIVMGMGILRLSQVKEFNWLELTY